MLGQRDRLSGGFNLVTARAVIFNRFALELRAQLVYRHFYSEALEGGGHQLSLKFFATLISYFCALCRLDGRRDLFARKDESERAGVDFARAHRRVRVLFARLCGAYHEILLAYNMHSTISYQKRVPIKAAGDSANASARAAALARGEEEIMKTETQRAFMYSLDEMRFYEEFVVFTLEILKMSFSEPRLRDPIVAEATRLLRSRSFSFQHQQRASRIERARMSLEANRPTPEYVAIAAPAKAAQRATAGKGRPESNSGASGESADTSGIGASATGDDDLPSSMRKERVVTSGNVLNSALLHNAHSTAVMLEPELKPVPMTYALRQRSPLIGAGLPQPSLRAALEYQRVFSDRRLECLGPSGLVEVDLGAGHSSHTRTVWRRPPADGAASPAHHTAKDQHRRPPLTPTPGGGHGAAASSSPVRQGGVGRRGSSGGAGTGQQQRYAEHHSRIDQVRTAAFRVEVHTPQFPAWHRALAPLKPHDLSRAEAAEAAAAAAAAARAQEAVQQPASEFPLIAGLGLRDYDKLLPEDAAGGAEADANRPATRKARRDGATTAYAPEVRAAAKVAAIELRLPPYMVAAVEADPGLYYVAPVSLSSASHPAAPVLGSAPPTSAGCVVEDWSRYDPTAEVDAVYQSLANGLVVTQFSIPADLMVDYEDNGVIMASGRAPRAIAASRAASTGKLPSILGQRA